MTELKSEIVKKAKNNDKLIMELATANKNQFISTANWFKRPLSKKLTEYDNLVIIAKFFRLPVADIINVTEEPETVNP